ncbi:alpha/beta fold hydrolase [Erythrobacter sp.]|uniref:alpha/beta fold hydrolase n=1 Tax=Erythrobacter sp. TaxID=1042 RepID=UPI001425F0DD|nr:alpha/beta fold hydrolase [Erythrobacter sp.]QIQ86315.1 MAG: alpha/beta fold hydrolase [Erythrobacter sp.]
MEHGDARAGRAQENPERVLPTGLRARLLYWLEIPRFLKTVATLPLRLVRHWPRRRTARAGEPLPVVVVPGFGFTDRSTLFLRWYLRRCGFAAQGWGLGRNMGRKTIGLHNARAIRAVEERARRAGQPVALVGWSMGGIVARMVARARPDLVTRVVSLSAPFTGNPYDNRAWPLYEEMAGHRLDDPVASRQIERSREPPPVPSLAIHSKSDGIVAAECCIERDLPRTTNIEVRAGHFEIGFKPSVLALVAEELAAQPV